MIKTKDAIAAARGLLGTPYSELDCINLIKKVIRDAPGGVKGYTTAGTNALWRSYDMSAKYKDLTWRQAGLAGAKAGMIAFKADDEDYRHAGIVTDAGTVIHSSSTQGGRGVVETPLTAKEGWTHLSIHRYIETLESGGEPQEESMESYRAIVTLKDPGSSLNVRNEPGRGGDVINKLFHGQSVTVQAEYENGWAYVQFGDSGKSGYVSMEYLTRDDEPEGTPQKEEDLPENVIRVSGTPVIVDGEGNEFYPVGGWWVEFRKGD